VGEPTGAGIQVVVTAHRRLRQPSSRFVGETRLLAFTTEAIVDDDDPRKPKRFLTAEQKYDL
jgi:hypothetical protein